MTTARLAVAALLLFPLGRAQEPSISCPSESPKPIRLSARNDLNPVNERQARLGAGDLDGPDIKGSPAPQAKPAPERIHVSCTATNVPYVLVHYDAANKKLDEQEHDDWRVRCTVLFKDKKIFDDELKLPRPVEFRDAMAAIDEFRTKRAPQLVHDAKEVKHEPKP